MSEAKQKIFSDDNVCGIISTVCCDKRCLSNFNFNVVQSLMKRIVCVSKKTRNQRLLDVLFDQMTSKEKDDIGVSKIGGKQFRLKLYGMTVCPVAFSRLHHCSVNTLRSIVTEYLNFDIHEVEEDEEDIVDGYKELTKKDRVTAFLNFLSEILSEPMLGYPEDYRRVSLFPDKPSVYKFFSLGECNGITSDCFEFTKMNEEDPVTLDWFTRVWRNENPLLFTESCRPQCCTCADFNSKIKKGFVDKDLRFVEEAKQLKKEHLQQARELFQFQEKYREIFGSKQPVGMVSQMARRKINLGTTGLFFAH